MNRTSSVTVGPTTFANKRQVITYFKDLLNRYEFGQRVNNVEHHKHLIGLLELPAGQDRTRGTGVEHFSVNRGLTHPDKKCIFVHRTNGTVSQVGFTTIMQSFEKNARINRHKVQAIIDPKVKVRERIKKAVSEVMNGFPLDGLTEEQCLEQCVLIEQLLRLELPAHWAPVLAKVDRDERLANDPAYQAYLRKKAALERAQRELAEAEAELQLQAA